MVEYIQRLGQAATKRLFPLSSVVLWIDSTDFYIREGKCPLRQEPVEPQAVCAWEKVIDSLQFNKVDMIDNHFKKAIEFFQKISLFTNISNAVCSK